MRRNRRLFVFCILISVLGCSQPIRTLRAVGYAQNKMQQEIDRQCRNFDLLLKDIQEGHLKPGIQRKEFIRIYGEPILEEEMDGRTELLYRYPLEFFASQKVYVYFDKNGYLLEWRVEI